MDPTHIIQELSRNADIIKGLLQGLEPEEYNWRPKEGAWCLLEILCHLYDEEREDFRARTFQVLSDPNIPLTPFDPQSWVTERNYMDKDYKDTLSAFLEERKESIIRLEALDTPKWENTYMHPKLGSMSAHLFLSNWLAHDYLHIRQIIKLKFELLKLRSGEDLSYAGSW